MRWGLIGFKAIFLFVFGGVGLGLMIFIIRAPKKKDLTAPEYRERPWLANDAWQSDAIKSNSKSAMYFTWGFATLWNLISAPLPFVIYDEILDKENYLALAGLLFPLVGIGLVTWAVRRTLEWKRFGPAILTLDPFPGSISGHVGGMIDVNLPYDPGALFSLTLTNLQSYVSGSGKNRSRKETAKWQDTQVAHTTNGPKGSRLIFRFDVPDGLQESDADKSEDTYYLWRLNLKAELPGTDIDRDYEIPVYATNQTSRRLSDFSIRQARKQQQQIDNVAIEKLLHLSYNAGGRELRFAMGRNLSGGLAGFICGAIFAGAGWVLITGAGHAIMGTAFFAVGSLILLSALYFVLNSLEITQDGDNIVTVRRILGVPVRRRSMRRTDFVGFNKKSSMQTQSAGKHAMYYSIEAVDYRGGEMIVGEGFKGAGQADAAAELIGREFGLKTKVTAPSAHVSVDDYNLLTADD